jgi:AcrR family transcriptional regulator
MFTVNNKVKKRGRPAGRTAQGHAAHRRLYEVAVSILGERGYDETTMRDVATAAGVSPGLLYRYFPSKRSVVLALYAELSVQYADQTVLRPGKWRERFASALDGSLHVLGPHRTTLRALIPVLVGTEEGGLFSSSTDDSRRRVESVFESAVSEAADAPGAKMAGALGRLLYLAHLAVILWWLLDRSPRQRATTALVSLIKQMLPSFALAARFAPVRGFVLSADALVTEALLGAGDR